MLVKCLGLLWMIFTLSHDYIAIDMRMSFMQPLNNCLQSLVGSLMTLLEYTLASHVLSAINTTFKAYYMYTIV